MISLKTLVFNPFQENTYLIYDETNECVIIDPGMSNTHEEKTFVDTIETLNLKPVKAILTHAHIDHVLGCSFVFEKYGLLPEGHSGDEFFLEQTAAYAGQFGMSVAKNPPSLGKHLNESDEIVFGNSRLEIIHVPGHSPGSLLYYNRESEILISGDVLFLESIGRSDLPGGNHSQLISGIKEKLMTLPDNVKVYPGHGPKTSIINERNGNPFLV